MSKSSANIPEFDPDDFEDVDEIDNPYLPLEEGSVWVYKSEEGLDIVKVTDQTKEILGVETTVVFDVAFSEGQLPKSPATGSPRMRTATSGISARIPPRSRTARSPTVTDPGRPASTAPSRASSCWRTPRSARPTTRSSRPAWPRTGDRHQPQRVRNRAGRLVRPPPADAQFHAARPGRPGDEVLCQGHRQHPDDRRDDRRSWRSSSSSGKATTMMTMTTTMTMTTIAGRTTAGGRSPLRIRIMPMSDFRPSTQIGLLPERAPRARLRRGRALAMAPADAA